MPRHSKRYNEKRSKLLPDHLKQHVVSEVFAKLKEAACAKFDESIDVAIRTSLDPRYADQQLRGSVVLPHGTGKTVRVAVFAAGEKAKEAEAAGADFVGAQDLQTKIEGGWTDFDACVATPDMMKFVGKLGRILGPRGLMPNPKVGTVTTDIGKVVQDLKSGKVQFRVEKAGIIHSIIGKASFDQAKLRDNFLSFMHAILKHKPSGAKGTYIKSISISSTMGPGFFIDVNDARAAAEALSL